MEQQIIIKSTGSISIRSSSVETGFKVIESTELYLGGVPQDVRKRYVFFNAPPVEFVNVLHEM